MKKSAIAAVLTLTMLLGLLPITARAVDPLSITQQPSAENSYTVKATYMSQEMDQGFQWYKRVDTVTTYTLVGENPQAGQLAVDKVYFGSYTDGHWEDETGISVFYLSSPSDEITVTVSGGDEPYDLGDGSITFTEGSTGVYTATSTGGMLEIHIDPAVDSDGTSPVTATITVKRCWTPVAGQTSASLQASESGTYYCAVSKEGEGAITNTVQVVVPHGSHPICGAACSGHTESHGAVTWTELTPEMVNNTSGSAYALTNKNYYLTDSFETDKSFTVSGNVNLCFNGHTITCRAKNPCANAVGGGSSSQLLINSGAVFNVCDCQGNGGFTRDLSTLTQRDKYMRVLMAENTCTINLYGGTFTGDNGYSFSSFENTALTVDGAVLTGYCNLNLLSNCTLVFQSGNVNCSDTAIMLQGTVTVTILGGTIYGKTYGVYLGPSNSLTLSGSPNISGGTAAISAYTSASNTSCENAKVDATNYNGNELRVKEVSPLSSKVGAYAIKGGEGKFNLTNTCYKYAYENGGMVIREDHNWATTWSSDGNYHWHNCNNTGCPITDNTQKDSYAAHTEVIDSAVPATCTTPGKTAGSHCSVCQYVITAQTNVPATGNHTYSGYEKNDTQHWRTCSVCHTATAKENHSGGTATCTAKAECTTCGQSYGELAAHSGGTATCTAKAVCNICKQEYGELAPNNHVTLTHTASVAATCTTYGVKEYWTCSGCGEHFSDANGTTEITDLDTWKSGDGKIEKAAHDFDGDYLSDENGHWHKCEKCDATDTKENHDWENDTDTTCDTCGYERAVTPVHTHQYGAWTSDAANHWHQCTAAGCPDLEGSKTDTAAHTEDGGTVTKPATSTEKGVRTYKCGICERVLRTEEIPMLNPPDPVPTHQYGGWASDAANHWHQCTAAGCPDLEGSKKDSTAHTEDDGTVTKPATNTEKGVRTYKCSVCQRILRTEEIPMLTEPTEPTYSISGTVTDHGNNNLSDVTVTLTRGNTKVAETTTSGGAYSFTGVKAGTYNVVAEQGSGDDRITKTILVELTDADATEKNIKMPDGKKNSRVEVTGADTPAVVVGGVDRIAEAETVAADETVTVTLTVEKKDDSAHNASEIKQVASGKTVEFLDLSLVKTVTGGSNAGTTNITDTGSKVLEIVVPYVFTGKKDVTVYRHHGNSAAALTKTDTKADGTFRLDEAGGLIYIYASRFSTYAIGYTETSGGDTPVTPPDKGDTPEPSTPSHSGGSSSPATYSPVIEKSTHGKAEVKPRNPEQGDRVTVTLTPDSGYQPDSVTVTDRNGRPVAVTDSGGGTYTFIQPRGKVTITASFKADGGYGSCPKDHTCPIARFPDASPTAWYHDGVHYCLEHGLMEGYDTGLFGPGDHLSRAHLVQMLYNQAGRPDVTEASGFEDVAPGAWCTKAVAWAQQSGIVSGYDSRRFHPDGRITREQLAAILWRYAGSPAATGLALDFTDAGNVSGYAADALRWAVDRKIIYGKGSGILDPTGLATRAEAASMLMRYGTIKIL